MRAIDHLLATEPPWLELLVLRAGQNLHELIYQIPKGFLRVLILGEACKTKLGLFSELGRALSFPSYFGQNWDAFEECINDLEWKPAKGYLIVVSNAEHLLIDNQKDYDIFMSIMQNAGKEWATPQSGEWPRPGIPFHTILTVSDIEEVKKRNWNIPVLRFD